jgi:hypothetical protein
VVACACASRASGDFTAITQHNETDNRSIDAGLPQTGSLIFFVVFLLHLHLLALLVVLASHLVLLLRLVHFIVILPSTRPAWTDIALRIVDKGHVIRSERREGTGP